jgi:hypothetical protein
LYKNVDRLGEYRNSSVPILRLRRQSVSGFADYYDALSAPGEASFKDVYHDVWRIFFRPSPPVAGLIEHEMKTHELEPGRYASAHLRALYGRITNRPDDQATDLVRNAINCASQLRPGGPFFFASDHAFSTRAAVEYGSQRRVAVHVSTRGVGFNGGGNPLHFDKAPKVKDRSPEDFYDTFVDLYLMGMSTCLTYNRGGFGHWALLIGYDAGCSLNQKTSASGITHRCNWTEPSVGFENDTSAGAPKEGHYRTIPLFLEPME